MTTTTKIAQDKKNAPTVRIMLSSRGTHPGKRKTALVWAYGQSDENVPKSAAQSRNRKSCIGRALPMWAADALDEAGWLVRPVFQ